MGIVSGVGSTIAFRSVSVHVFEVEKPDPQKETRHNLSPISKTGIQWNGDYLSVLHSPFHNGPSFGCTSVLANLWTNSDLTRKSNGPRRETGSYRN